MIATHPSDPIAAATHADPYPFYAELVAQRPLYYDAALGLWVASSAAAVAAVLSNPACRVRPSAEPIPRGLLGTPAATLFGALVRMNDGPAQCPLKHAVTEALAINPADAIAASQAWADRVCAELDPRGDPGRLDDFCFRLPLAVVAGLLGIPHEQIGPVTLWVRDFARCLTLPAGSPGSSAGAAAADGLLGIAGAVLAGESPGHNGGLLAALARAAARLGLDDATSGTAWVAANGIGFLVQTYEATAGLIGNTLASLAANPALRAQIGANPALLPAIVQEVLRWDPPVQNTRRFVAESGIGADAAEAPWVAGDAILVVLAAANRDPAANEQPERFDPWRAARRTFGFGLGAHACPGQSLAPAIAVAGVERLLLADAIPTCPPIAYRAAANTRIPRWAATPRIDAW